MNDTIHMVLLVGLLAIGLGAEEVTWRFSSGPEFPGAKGEMTRNGDDIALRSDFTGGGHYVGACCDLKTPQSLREIRFKVRGEACGIAVRMIDSDRQAHQFFPELSGNPQQWQEVALPVTGSPRSHWGGKNDGVFRNPLRTLGLIVRNVDLGKKKIGKIEISDLRLIPQEAETMTDSALPVKKEFYRFSNGAEFPGAAGTLLNVGDKLRLRGDFTNGGVYISAGHRLKRSAKFSALNVTVKGDARRIGVRFRDASGQIHQHFQRVEPGRETRLNFPAVGSPQSHWGGDNDGKLKFPISELIFVVHATDLGRAKKGDIDFSNIVLEKVASPNDLLFWSVPQPEQLFRLPGDDTPVTLFAVLPHNGKEEFRRYILRDYSGKEVASGIGRYDAETGTLSAQSPAGRGFFELVYPELGICVGVAVDDAPPARIDEYFGVDTSFSWGRGPSDEAMFRTYMRILRKNGIVWMRDRLDWRHIEPEKEKFRFDNRFELLRRSAMTEKMKTLDVFHDAPDWTGAAERRKNNDPQDNVYPDDQFSAGNSFAVMMERWGQTVRALEVWNEPEFSGNGFPPEYAVAFTKAVSRRFATRKINTLVVGGVITTPKPDTGYYEAFVENSLLEDCDVMSFHSYSDTPTMERIVDFLRGVEIRSKSPRAGIPIWITESGKPWKRGGDRASLPGDITSAAEIAAKAVEMRALGLERFFAFSFKYYDEVNNNFGMMDLNHTPMRSMAAYGHVARLFAHSVYIGDLRKTGAVRARVFDCGEYLTACLYTGTGIDRKTYLTLPAELPVIRAEGADGRPLVLNGRNLPMHDGIAFLFLPKDLPNFLLDTGTNAMRLYNIARAYQPSPRAAKPLLLQPATDVKQLLPTIYGFYAPQYESVEFKVRVNNFGNVPLTFDPEVKLPAAAQLLTAPKPVTVPPDDSRECAFRIALDPKIGRQGKFPGVVISDRNGNATQMRFSVKPYRRETVAALPESVSNAWTDISGGINWSTWPGGSEAPNIEAKFRVSHTGDKLILRVLVKDESHHNAFSAPEAWRGDSIQFTLQMRNNDKKRSDWCEITAARSRDGMTLYCHRGKSAGLLRNSKLDFKQTNSREFLYEITLDPAELGLTFQPGNTLGCALLVNSNSGGGRDGYLSWGRGIAEGIKSDTLFNLIELKKENERGESGK